MLNHGPHYVNHYWNILHYTPQDEIDKGIICLLADKSDPKELFEALQETIKNRGNNLKNKNNSNGKDALEGDDCDESDDLVDPRLIRQIQEFIIKWTKFKGKILYGELKTLVEERIQFCDEEYLQKINLEFEHLREIIQKAIELTFKINVWFLDIDVESLQKIESADKVYELLSQEVSRHMINGQMLERRALIRKMIKLEKNEHSPNFQRNSTTKLSPTSLSSNNNNNSDSIIMGKWSSIITKSNSQSRSTSRAPSRVPSSRTPSRAPNRGVSFNLVMG
ncbi:hypothetical protein Glove_117g35 [Diversispora epigaea]|uniref:Uncharacterized protein n=1 Tax=Diversispora epigaea TaxID=1348612 RepID=A0A397J9K5_9GLOM|nr:hypothetical protein Glove_117g35 [Diversispora epigaea]